MLHKPEIEVTEKENIITHHGLFHADDVLAVSLYKYFKNSNINIERVHHNTKTFKPTDICIDIGLDYNGETRFDHHQYKHGMSACALIWILVKRYLKAECKFLERLVKEVSDADVGLARQPEQHYSGLIAKMNSSDTHDHVTQMAQFMKAVDFTTTIIDNAYKAAIELKETFDIIATLEVKNGVLELPRYLKGWVSVVYEINKPVVKITHVIWPNKNVPDDETWSIQIPNVANDSFELVAAPMKPSYGMKFVHANGFYAVAYDRTGLELYMKEIDSGIFVNKKR